MKKIIKFCIIVFLLVFQTPAIGQSEEPVFVSSMRLQSLLVMHVTVSFSVYPDKSICMCSRGLFLPKVSVDSVSSLTYRDIETGEMVVSESRPIIPVGSTRKKVPLCFVVSLEDLKVMSGKEESWDSYLHANNSLIQTGDKDKIVFKTLAEAVLVYLDGI